MKEKKYKCRETGTKNPWTLIEAIDAEIAACVFAEEHGVDDEVAVLGAGIFKIFTETIYQAYKA